MLTQIWYQCKHHESETHGVKFKVYTWFNFDHKVVWCTCKLSHHFLKEDNCQKLRMATLLPKPFKMGFTFKGNGKFSAIFTKGDSLHFFFAFLSHKHVWKVGQILKKRIWCMSKFCSFSILLMTRGTKIVFTELPPLQVYPLPLKKKKKKSHYKKVKRI